jgi:hypothetical protein
VLADVAAYPSWWPAKSAVRVLRAHPDLVGTEIEVRPLMGRVFCWRFEELDEPHSIRLRIFGGSLEGPGGFLILPEDNLTRIRYEIDVFARGLDFGAFSRLLPLERIHSLQMRSLLKSLGRRLEEHQRSAPEASDQRPVQRVKTAVERDAEEALAAASLATAEAPRPAAPESTVHLEEEGEVARLVRELAAARASDQAALRAAEVAAAKLSAEEKFFLAAQESAARLAGEFQTVRAEEGAARRAAEEETARLSAELAEARAAQENLRQAMEAETARLSAELTAVRAEHETFPQAIEAETARLSAELAAARAAEASAARLATEETSAKWAAEQVARRAAESAAAHAHGRAGGARGGRGKCDAAANGQARR